MGDGFYRSKDPTNSIIVLKEMLQRKSKERKQLNHTYRHTIIDTKKDRYTQNKHNKSTSLHYNGVTRG